MAFEGMLNYGGGLSRNYNPYAFDAFYGPAASPATTAAKIPGAVTPVAPATYNPAVGGIPSVPDPLKSIADAIAAYTKNLPALQALANVQTAANQEAQVKQITDLYPQFKANTAQLGANVADWAAGKLSTSTTNALTRAMMERGVAGGFGPDSGQTNAALMALMGKTSEALQGQGLTGQNTILAGLPKTTPTTVASLGMTPESIFSPLYNAQLQAALYAAAPNPADAYNLAMSNATRGLGMGGAAGRGPYAGVPTTGGTSSPEILKMLQDLMQRPFSTTPSPTQTATAPASTINYSDYAMPGMDFGGEFDTVQPGANYDPYAPTTGGGFYDDLTGDYYP